MKLRKVKKNGKRMWMADLGFWQGKRERIFRDATTEGKKELERFIKDRKAQMRRDGERVFNLSHQEIARLEAADQRAKAAGFTSINQCVDIAIAHGKPMHPKPIDKAILECVSAKVLAGKRRIYTQKLRNHLDSFRNDLGEAIECHKITRHQIESWAWKGQGETKVKPVTARGRVIDVGTLFAFCLKRRWCLLNPVAEMEPILLENKPPGIHAVEQVEKFLKHCLCHEHGKNVICYVALGYFGGLRPTEALRLTADNIDLNSKLINVEADKAKTRRRRLIPINDTLAAWLNISNTPNCVNWRRKFLAVKAGFPWPHDVLRHSFCSYGLPKFGAQKIAEWAGHSETILFAHYRERVKPADADKYWALRP
jgi:integrase